MKYCIPAATSSAIASEESKNWPTLGEVDSCEGRLRVGGCGRISLEG